MAPAIPLPITTIFFFIRDAPGSQFTWTHNAYAYWQSNKRANNRVGSRGVVLRHIGFVIFRIHKRAFPACAKGFGEELLSHAIFFSTTRPDPSFKTSLWRTGWICLKGSGTRDGVWRRISILPSPRLRALETK